MSFSSPVNSPENSPPDLSAFFYPRDTRIRELAPVDLNALLASDHYLVRGDPPRRVFPALATTLTFSYLSLIAQLGGLYETYSSVNITNSTLRYDNATSRAELHYQQGALLKDALLDLFWDPIKLAFYDFVSPPRFLRPFVLIFCPKLTRRSSQSEHDRV